MHTWRQRAIPEARGAPPASGLSFFAAREIHAKDTQHGTHSHFGTRMPARQAGA